MSNSEKDSLWEALQNLKEAYLLRIAKTHISSHIPDGEILMLARTRTPPQVIQKLKQTYFFHYWWNRLRRMGRRKFGR